MRAARARKLLHLESFTLSWAGEGREEEHRASSFHFPQPERGQVGRGGAREPQERKGRGGERGASLGLCSGLSLRTPPRHLPRRSAVHSRHTLVGCPDSPVSAPRNPCDACVSLQPNSAPSGPAPPPRLPVPGSPEPASCREADIPTQRLASSCYRTRGHKRMVICQVLGGSLARGPE